MVKLIIDKLEVEADHKTTVLAAALDNGIFIPHFCWHPLLSISGNCRMCVVEMEGRDKLEISCNLPVAEGMVIRTDTKRVRDARRDVLEYLLVNHPLDCPICDQAGECLLQDYYFKYSGAAGRFREAKVKKPKVVDIGRNMKLDDERCILCTRCVRFCREVAGKDELCVADKGDGSYITTAPMGRLDNPYSLNTVDLCPVGALTSSDFRFKKRVWLLKSSASICPACSNGCPIFVDHSGGRMYRWRPRNISDRQFSASQFLCDEGRLSYKEWQLPTRITKTRIQMWDGFKEVSREEALQHARLAIGGLKEPALVGIVSAKCSCEEIDAFRGFVKRIYRTTPQPQAQSSDNIIIKADKNPNSKYLDELKIEDVPENLSGAVLIVLDRLSDDDTIKISGFTWQVIMQITHDESALVPGVDIVFPRATFLESGGTFVNFSGLRQVFEKALEPMGEAMTAAEWLNCIGQKV
jgi:NADH-quinone oxidoreductase subunit G